VLKLSQASTPEPVEIQDYFDETGDLRPPPFSRSHRPDIPLVAAAEGMAAWSELASSLAETPLFPVDGLAQMRSLLAPILAGDERWRRFNENVDAAVRRTAGDDAVAEGARDRAFSLFKAGRLREAVGELHAAKVN
jgi:hypothetical protein